MNKRIIFIKSSFIIMSIFMSSIALAYCLELLSIPITSAIYLFVFVSYIVVMQKIAHKPFYTHVFITCLIFSFFQLVGMLFENGRNLSFARICSCIVASLSIAVLLYGVLYVIVDKMHHKALSTDVFLQESTWRKWLVYSVILFVLWLPTLLAFFPGLFSVDVPTQIVERIGSYNTHHPLIHTLLLQALFYTGKALVNGNFGVLIYEIVQMVVLAMILAKAIVYIEKCGISKVLKVLLIVFFGLYPVTSTMAITTTKDTLFGAFFVSFIINILELKNDHDKKRYMKLVLSGVLCMLFRNNAVIVIPICFVLLAICVPKIRKAVWVSFVFLIVLYSVINGSAKFITKATDDPTHCEMLSIPCQQLARVYVMEKEDLSEGDKGKILKYVPDAESYNPYLSDYTKNTERIDGDISGFIPFYFKLMRKYPYRYIESFLLNTKGYWDLNDTASNNSPGGADGTVGYMWLYIWQHEGVEHSSKLVGLRDWYYEFFALNEIEKYPFVNTIFRFSLFFWIILFAHAFYREHKGTDKIVSICFIGIELLMITYLAGPCAYPRYAFPFILLTPLMLGAVKKNYFCYRETNF